MTPRNNIPANTVTRYEIGLIRDGKTLVVIGYTAKKTKNALLTAPQGQDLTSYFTEEELDGEWKYKKSHGVMFGDSIRIAFTGKTEREAKQFAELF
jgi:hypothetical protein